MLQQLTITERINLHENALWVIMDPWVNQSELLKYAIPGTVNILPGYNINDWNKIWADRIANYLPRVKNWLVITDLGYHDIVTKKEILSPIDPRFSHLPVIEHRYMKKDLICQHLPKDCTSIVYTGFHEHMCVLWRPYIGYNNINKENNINLDKYIALELTCHWPSPDLKIRLGKQSMRRRPEYKYIRVMDDVK